VKSANLVYVNSSGFPNLIQSFNQPSSKTHATWSGDIAPGVYSLYVDLSLQNNSSSRSQTISITVESPPPAEVPTIE